MSRTDESKLPVIKVAILGPKSAGKTRISNHLYGMVVPSDVKYDPTIGVRILQMTKEFPAKREKGKDEKDTTMSDVAALIELWDCSGDQKFESCWPAIMKDLHGVMVVFDPLVKSQANEVRVWCEFFSKGANLQSDQCVIFAHGTLTATHKPLSIKAGGSRVVMANIVNANTNARQPQGKEADNGRLLPSTCEVEFLRFLGGVYPFALELGIQLTAAPGGGGGGASSVKSPTAAAAGEDTASGGSRGGGQGLDIAPSRDTGGGGADEAGAGGGVDLGEDDGGL